MEQTGASGSRIRLFYISLLPLIVLQFVLFLFWGEQNPAVFLLLPSVITLALCIGARHSYFFYILIFFIPLSFSWHFSAYGLTVFIPSELLIGWASLFFVFQFFFWGNATRFQFFREPLSILAALYLAAAGLSAIFSTMPVVSLKALIVRFCYVVCFFIVLQQIANYTRHWRFFYWVYALGFMIVIAFVWYKHAAFDFSKDKSGLVTAPFYADHTIYATCASVLLPFFFAEFGLRKKGSFSQIGVGALLLLLILAIFFAASRAAWLSLAAGAVFWIYLRLRLPFRYILFATAAIIGLFLIFQDSIFDSLKNNRTDSNAKKSGAIEQIQSIGNIRTDWSNLERINRWSCAYRMFLARPLTGFGVGTYQYAYTSFQKQKEMTPISVRTPYSLNIVNGGNAHSEFFNLLSETGFLGGLCWLLLFVIGLQTGFKLCYHPDIPFAEKQLAYASLCGLFIYFCNGLFNSFLDTDKAAFLFWGNLALIASLARKYRLSLG
jgi:O-antigen ligase